jgi:hypothetical protein
MKSNRFYALLFLIASFVVPVSGQTINWGSTLSDMATGNQHRMADNSGMPNGFTFQLGSFGAGFNRADPTTWSSTWSVYTDSNPAGGDGVANFSYPISPSPFGYFFSESTTIENSAFSGRQAYVWGSDSFGAGMTQAVLYTNSTWNFPTVGSLTVDDWNADLSTDVVWGAIDRNIGDLGGELVGGGTRTAPAAANTYHIQTALTTAVVPEPSGALLIGALGIAALLRRRSSRRI